MYESLAWLRDPETEPALSVLLCGLIRDIRLILVHPDLGNAAKLGAITQTVDQLAPAPGPQASAAPAAALVAALLANGTGTATGLFEELAGERILIELTRRADRPLTANECLELRTSPGTAGHQRTGTLRTANSGTAAAEVTSLVIPGRLPADARRALGIPGPDDPAPPPSGIPLGKALAGFGVHREPLGARMMRDSTRIPGSHVAVESSARIWLDGVPVALASERVTAEFCQQARTRLASTRAAAVPGPRVF
ncbi:MAG TPA: hypothetical protein VHT26_15970 [Trebonia sp.]|jgi:hypothetical protein|nr:hypothetical protein [Trebonia sp.]